MSWRKHSTHREETRAVKEALAAAGIQAKKVGHGRGTGWGWLEVYLGENPGGLQHEKLTDSPTPWLCRGGCPACELNREIDREVYRIVGEVTGRKGEYNGNVLILHQDVFRGGETPTPVGVVGRRATPPEDASPGRR